MQKEKRLVPKIRFPEFKENWKLSKVGKETDFSNGKGHEKYIDNNGKYIVVNSKFISTQGKVKKYVSEVIEPLYENDIVMVMSDVPNGRALAKCFLIPENNTYSLNQRICKLGQKNNHNPFLIYVINRNLYFLKFDSGVGQTNLKKDEVLNCPIKIPIDLSEQQKIADFLTAVDSRLQSLEKKKSLLEEYKKGIIQQIFKQELRFKDEDGKEFSEWEFKRGNLLFKSVSDKDHNSDLPILAITQDQGAIPRDQIDYNIGVTAKSVSSYKVVQVGDFIISLRSFQGGIEYSNYHGICSPAYIILRPIKEMDRDFYKYYLKTPSYIGQLVSKLEGIRDGKMVSYKYFSEIKLPYPSLKEQTKIANFLSALDKKIELVDKQIEKTKTYKKGLLQQMFV